jgi:hypothetical protein
VRFTVDGRPLGDPVPVTNGVATSAATSTLGLGSHAVTATYSGTESYVGSSGSLTQVVRLDVRVISPSAGTRFRAGSVVPVAFQLTDSSGRPISHLAAVLLLASGRVSVSAGGAQTLPALPPLYDPFTSRFVLPLPTTRHRTGPVTITITVTYPGAPAQQVTVPITLT